MKKFLCLFFFIFVCFVLFADNSISFPGFSFNTTYHSNEYNTAYSILDVKKLDIVSVATVQRLAADMSFDERIELWKSLNREKRGSGFKYSLLNCLGFGIGSFAQGDKKAGYTYLGIDLACTFVGALLYRAQENAYLEADLEKAGILSDLGGCCLSVMGVTRLVSIIHPYVYNAQAKAYNEKLALALNFYGNALGVSGTVSF